MDAVKSSSAAYLEWLVINLPVRMDYGCTRKDAGRAVGRSGDGGIDGIIDEDRLGLDTVYIRAKEWDNTVSRPEVQEFAEAVQGQRTV